MPYLKLNLPLNGDADGGRQNFRVKIHSLEKWRQEVSASPQNRFTNADKDFAIDGRRVCDAVTNIVTVDSLVAIILNATNVAKSMPLVGELCWKRMDSCHEPIVTKMAIR
ncbi:hypothetical protein QQX98_010165 [Neonectria punicea]|uniref:Uncharacterized protein n=1 Tax=Neonectria punicea TaxID=979145 RepID=A0ABR1GQK2_9HYPO